MNKVYEAVADCRKTFVEMSFAFTHDINEIEEAVQECLMYFLQMNPTVLKRHIRERWTERINKIWCSSIKKKFYISKKSLLL
jgi:hypothetical protein